MAEFDVVFLHPPFIAETPDQFSLERWNSRNVTHGHVWGTLIPMGVFSMAALLEDQGFGVKVINLGVEGMLGSKIDAVITRADARVYAIDLQWVSHSNGAIITAKLCKELHPSSFVVLGGFTATHYDLEIMRSYPFIDGIIRGEGEHPILELTKTLRSNREPNQVGSLTWRRGESLERNRILRPARNIDSLDFTRLGMLEHSSTYLKCLITGYQPSTRNSFYLNIARGCVYDCIFCGGSRSCYPLLTERIGPAHRSPEKVAQDIARLSEMGVEIVDLSHDPEIFGRNYTSSLLRSIKQRSVDIALYWESHRLPSKDFVEHASKTFNSLNVAISPESASEDVRMHAGRLFTNRQFFESLRVLEENSVLSDIYFLIGLPGETLTSALEYNTDFITKIVDGSEHSCIPPIIPYMIDPHCQMSLHPEKHQVKLFLRSFADYQRACGASRTIEWIGHETATLSRERTAMITDLLNQFVSSMIKKELC